MSDFLICGAGVSGLLLARELLASGATVTVLERQFSGREASWAGGGIVSPLYPWRYNDAVTALARHAQRAYPVLSSALREETGIDPQLTVTGLLMLDADDHQEALDWAGRQQQRMTELDAGQIVQQVPGLAERFERGLWMPDIANVRNPRLMKALRAAVQAHPRARLVEQCEVIGFELAAATGDAATRPHEAQPRPVTGVQTRTEGHQQIFRATQYVVATGAWSGELLSPLGLDLPVEPVKGQMLLYQAAPDLLQTMVLTRGRYLIPRRDGHILIGSTLEYSGFDKTTDDEARQSLHASAISMLPALAQAPVVAHWAGLRPGAPAGVPFIGRLPGYTNLHINAGHFRNGLVLAPAAAGVLADLLLERPPRLDPQPYAPQQRLPFPSMTRHSAAG